jgi:hypothetical protein
MGWVPVQQTICRFSRLPAKPFPLTTHLPLWVPVQEQGNGQPRHDRSSEIQPRYNLDRLPLIQGLKIGVAAVLQIGVGSRHAEHRCHDG